jgi:hypothetical protein
MFFSMPIALASAALMGLAVADWDGTMRDTDVLANSVGCSSTSLFYGGNPSDSEYEELCTPANTYVALVTRSPLLSSLPAKIPILSSGSHATARPWCCMTTVPAASRMFRTQTSTALSPGP